MEWYLPITIVPGIGLLILSTSNIMLALNREISELETASASGENCDVVIRAKLAQLKTVSFSIMFQYLGVLLFLLSGLGSFSSQKAARGFLVAGVGFVAFSIALLLVYSIRAIAIRQKHLKIS